VTTRATTMEQPEDVIVGESNVAMCHGIGGMASPRGTSGLGVKYTKKSKGWDSEQLGLGER
jgi:hypothetical protein